MAWSEHAHGSSSAVAWKLRKLGSQAAAPTNSRSTATTEGPLEASQVAQGGLVHQFPALHAQLGADVAPGGCPP